MKRAPLAFLFALLLAACATSPQLAEGQNSPAQWSITPLSQPEVLQVLDSAKVWVPVGYVNPLTHVFTPVGGGGGGPSGASYPQHAALLAAASGMAASGATMDRQGYYAPGDGGAATYDWNSTSLATADGVVTVLPSGQSSSVPGRYVMRGAGGTLHSRQLGLVADAYFGSDAVIAVNAGVVTLTSAGRSCVPGNAPLGDVGKVVTVNVGGPGAALPTPAAPTLGTSTTSIQGGAPPAIDAGTFYVEVWYDAPQASGAPGATLPSAVAGPQVVNSGSVLTIASPPMVQGARGWHYAAATSGVGPFYQQDDATSYLPIGLTMQMGLDGFLTSIPAPSGGTIPTANNTAQGFVLHTKVDACNGAAYTLHDPWPGPAPVTVTASGSWTTAATTIPVTACPSPTPTVGATVWDASIGPANARRPTALGTFASCATNQVTLGVSPYSGLSKPPVASHGTADILTFGGTGFWSISTDNSAILAPVTAANARARIHFACGNFGFDSGPVALSYITLEGCDQTGDLTAFVEAMPALKAGTTFYLTSLTTSPFTLGLSPHVVGINTFHPTQMGTQPAPQVTPPDWSDDGVNPVSSPVFDRVSAYNPFVWIMQTNWKVNLAKSFFHKINAYTVDTTIHRATQSETMFMSDSDFNCNVGRGICTGGQSYLQSYSNKYANWQVVGGIGGQTTCSGTGVGQHVVNTTWHNFHHIFHIAGGSFTESVIASNDAAVYDAALYISPLGSINNSIHFIGGMYQDNVAGSTGESNIDVNSVCTAGQNGGQGTLTFTDTNLTSGAGAISVTGGNLVALSVTGGAIPVGLTAGLASPEYAVYLNAPNLDFSLSGVSRVNQAHTGANYDGVRIDNVKAAAINGTVFDSNYSVLNLANYVSGAIALSGNVAVGTAGSSAIIAPTFTSPGAIGNRVVIGKDNNFDKPPTWTFGQLDACNAAGLGTGMYQITDASTAPAWNAAVTAGGSNNNALVACTKTGASTYAWTAH